MTQWNWLLDFFGRSLPVVEVLDVGAMADGEERYKPLVDLGLASVTGFEPNDKMRVMLERDHPNHRYLPHFLGNGKNATFHVTRFPGCCSLYEPNPDVIDLFMGIGTAPGDNFHLVASVPVSTTRLDDVDGLNQPDFVKIDTQGSELDILRHGAARLKDAVVVEVEVEFAPLYKNQPLFGEIQMHMAQHGFMLHTLVDLAGRAVRPFFAGDRSAPISQLLWADAIFVRDFTRMDLLSDDQLLKAVAILTTLYQSVDVASLYVLEYDRRAGTNCHGRFIDKVVNMGLTIPFLPLRPPH